MNKDVEKGFSIQEDWNNLSAGTYSVNSAMGNIIKKISDNDRASTLEYLKTLQYNKIYKYSIILTNSINKAIESAKLVETKVLIDKKTALQKAYSYSQVLYNGASVTLT